MRRPLVLVTAAVLALGGLAPAAASAGPGCGITWGSLEKAAPQYTQATVEDVRAGRHDCYDRLVVDLGHGARTGYLVRYVAPFRQDFSGEPIPLRGAADLEVIVNAPSYDDDLNPTWDPPDHLEAVNVTGFATFRQVVDAVSWEGQTQIGLGVRARLPFRAFVLAGPGASSRLVVDVAHTW
jgi:hypothetical protein